LPAYQNFSKKKSEFIIANKIFNATGFWNGFWLKDKKEFLMAKTRFSGRASLFFDKKCPGRMALKFNNKAAANTKLIDGKDFYP